MIPDTRWVINLGNSICGVSLLVLPYCFSQCGVLLGVILLSFSAVLTKWSCHLLLECVFATKSASYEAVAKELYGPFGKLLVEISSTTLNIGCCSAFFVIVSDLAPGVISWALHTGPITPSLHIVILTSLGLTVILPLSLVRNLEPLNFISLGSMVFYIILTFQLFLLAIIFATSDNTLNHIHLWNFKGIFNVLPIYALAFSCHLQMLAVTREVVGEIRSDGIGEELSRMKWISKGAVSLVGVVYGSVSFFGHIAFCSSGVRADVLSNFNNGIISQITRCGFAVSVLLSFPFIVNPCRATLYSLIYGKTDKYIPTQKHFLITSGIVFIAFFVAVTTPNVALVVALTGAISGAVICYLFPSVSYLCHPKINHTQEQKTRAYVLIAIGVLLLTAGTMSAVMTSTSQDKGSGDTLAEKNPAEMMSSLLNKDPSTGEKTVNKEEEKEEEPPPVAKETKAGGAGVGQVLLGIDHPGVAAPDNPLIAKVGQVLTGARTLQEDKGKKKEDEEQKIESESENSVNNNKDDHDQQEVSSYQQEEFVDNKDSVAHDTGVGTEGLLKDTAGEDVKTEPSKQPAKEASVEARGGPEDNPTLSTNTPNQKFEKSAEMSSREEHGDTGEDPVNNDNNNNNSENKPAQSTENSREERLDNERETREQVNTGNSQAVEQDIVRPVESNNSEKEQIDTKIESNQPVERDSASTVRSFNSAVLVEQRDTRGDGAAQQPLVKREEQEVKSFTDPSEIVNEPVDNSGFMVVKETVRPIHVNKENDKTVVAKDEVRTNNLKRTD